ncbi:MAG: two-component system sensor histidine kinase NtrB [Endomicrobiales bacterium]
MATRSFNSSSKRLSGELLMAGLLMMVIGALLLLVPFFIAVSWLRNTLFFTFFLFCLLCFIFIKSFRDEKAEEENRESISKDDFEEQMKKMKEEQKLLVSSEKLSALSKFSSVVAHELKNPLASLKNISYFLTKTAKPDDEKGKKMLVMMSGEIDRTNDMVTSLSEISKTKKINKSLVNAGELVDAVLIDFKVAEIIQVNRHIDPVEATIDPDRFKQMLLNLLTNARDALSNGGQIEVSLKKAGENLELAVQDTGMGMDKETLDQIFEPMFTTKTKVLGLGLTVVKEIAENHKGKVTVESAKDQGATFKVYLPL